LSSRRPRRAYRSSNARDPSMEARFA
jgi:hypothetical protein